jgi:hypothetical protein
MRLQTFHRSLGACAYQPLLLLLPAALADVQVPSPAPTQQTHRCQCYDCLSAQSLKLDYHLQQHCQHHYCLVQLLLVGSQGPTRPPPDLAAQLPVE